MRVLITGNMGYLGPPVAREVRARWPEAEIIGLDTGFFAHCLSGSGPLPEVALDRQIFADVRDVTPETFPHCDVVICLAALSNDLAGDLDEEATLAINHRAAVRIAEIAKRAGAAALVFASSCSVYGHSDTPRTETSELRPLSTYARSKALAERDLAPLASESFVVTCLRFGTACGMSERLRLDLVLNDFVAGAVASRHVRVVSDGSPWRPLVDVRDMARATAWAVSRRASNGGAFVAVNVGSDRCTFQVRELAELVAATVGGTRVSVNEDAHPDPRSYRADFSLLRQLAPGDLPCVSIEESIATLVDGLESIDKTGAFWRERYLRAGMLRKYRTAGELTDDLRWSEKAGVRVRELVTPGGL